MVGACFTYRYVDHRAFNIVAVQEGKKDENKKKDNKKSYR